MAELPHSIRTALADETLLLAAKDSHLTKPVSIAVLPIASSGASCFPFPSEHRRASSRLASRQPANC